jgi:sorting nexin-4
MFGSFFKTFTKVKKPDEKFEEMKETIDKFEDNLNIVEKLYSRIGKRQQELEQNYNLFASSIRGLSALETNVDQPLRQFAEATETYVELLKEMVKSTVIKGSYL